MTRPRGADRRAAGGRAAGDFDDDARCVRHAHATRSSWAGALPELRFDAHLKQDTLTGRADGRFEGFNPARLLGRKELDGTVTGTVNANYAIRNISAPITPDAVTADGTLALTQSTVGGLKIDSAAVEGRYAAQVGDIVQADRRRARTSRWRPRAASRSIGRRRPT